MYTARIVVLTIALSAGGVAAYLASGSDNKFLQTEPVVQLRTVDVPVAGTGVGLGQLVARAPFIAGEPIRENRSDNQAPKRGEGVNVVRYGVSSPTTTQK